MEPKTIGVDALRRAAVTSAGSGSPSSPPPAPERSAAPPPRSRSAGSNSPLRRDRNKRLRLYRTATLILAVMLAGVLIGWIDTWVDLNEEENDRFRLAAELRNQTAELQRLRDESKKMREDLAALAQNRLPDLRKIDYDNTLPINERYLRNISFTRTGVGGAIRYEFRVVLENQGPDAVTPKLQVLLFDGLGLQVGEGEIAPKGSIGGKSTEFLAPSERRAYTESIRLRRNAAPEFFLVILD